MALPVSLLLRGLTNSPTTHQESKRSPVTIRQKKHATSPHVLSLRQQRSPEKILREKAVIAPKIEPATFNEFATEFFAHLDQSEKPEPVTESEHETLDFADIEDQLLENDLNESVSFLKRIQLPSLSILKRKEKQVGELETVIKEISIISEMIEEEVNEIETTVKRKLTKFHFPTMRLPKLRLPEMRFKTPQPLMALHPSLRGISVFVLLSFVFVLPLQAMNRVGNTTSIKNQLILGSEEALGAFEEAAAATARVDFSSAQQSFEEAGEILLQAENTLNELGAGVTTLISLIPSQGKTLKSGKALIELGRELSMSAERISEGFIAISNLADPSLGTKIEVLQQYLQSALPHVQLASESLSRIDPDSLPSSQRQAFTSLARTLPSIEEGLTSLDTFSDALNTILGNKEKRRYLFLFQNDAEIRPTGGFIGSFAEIDVQHGEIESITMPGGGSYDLQGSLTEFVAAPEPLQLVNARWEFHDANWSPDFKTSAEKLLWFHENAGGPTVDGVIAINAHWVSELLQLLGPIDMPEYGRTIDAENFLFETQNIVENEYDREENKPKQFLADLAPKLIERITKADETIFLPLLSQLSNGLANKDIQVYFRDAEIQKQMRDLGWTGEMKRTTGDYVMVVNANIGGQKTDAVIDETVTIDSEIMTNGRIQNTVSVTRQHRGIPGALFTGSNNVTYTRLYVPRGSTLLSVEGSVPPKDYQFEKTEEYFKEDNDLAFFNASATRSQDGTVIGEEYGKTVFGNWMQTRPGMSTTMTFTYELPWELYGLKKDNSLFGRVSTLLGLIPPTAHTITIDPQSGMYHRETLVNLRFPKSLNPLWSTDLIDEGTLRTTFSGSQAGFAAVLFDE